MTRETQRPPPGEIPEGRAEFLPSLYAHALQRTLEPVLETGVTWEARFQETAGISPVPQS